MAELEKKLVRIVVSAGNEDVIFVCRKPNARDMAKFLNSRYTQRRNKIETRLYEARAEFVDAILVDVENVTFKNSAGVSVPLNAQTQFTDEDRASWAADLDVRPSELTWKDLLPLNWKSGVAMYFEDAQSRLEGDEGN